MQNDANAVGGEKGINIAEYNLSNRNLWSFSLGGIGRDMAYALFNTYILTFILFTRELTDAQFTAITAIIVVSRIFDAFNDPIMGVIVENTRTRFGRFKPWILIGAVGCAAVIITVFNSTMGGWEFIAFLAVIYLLFSITFTMNDISYWSMIPALSRNERDRNKLTSMTILFSSIGAGIISISVPVFTAGSLTLGGSTISAYKIIAVVTGIMFVACQLMTVSRVKEPVFLDNPDRANLGLKGMFKIIKNNDQTLWIALISLLFNIGNALFTSVSLMYVYFEFNYDGMLTVIFGVLAAVASVAVNTLYPKISKRFSKKNLLSSAIVAIVAGYALMALFGALIPAGEDNQWMIKFGLMVVAFFFVGYGQSLFYMISMTTFANTVEYNEWKTGERRESIIFTIRPFMAKLGSALLQLVIMFIYLIVGVLQYTNGISSLEKSANLGKITAEEKLGEIQNIIESVPEAKKIALILCITAIPVVFLLSAYFLYRKKIIIDEKFYAKMLEDISQRKSK
ncbi:MAG: glycoside-pentoside-hexuronide (GPH):cation symporter [Clostridiales bacterium]|jgi:melibiose permease/lactose/raffinose/galactose permease|nr:glycoside-pentoside-hexuronide (GPH):cation symporter [Clostridiales bacterium]